MAYTNTKDLAEDFCRMLHFAADCIQYYYRISALHDCNDCGKNPNDCEYIPRCGEHTRINCPLWQESERKDE